MRYPAIAVTALAAGLAAAPAAAEVPNSILSLFGPGIGYLLAQSDLCGWNMTDKIKTIYAADFKTLGMTESQQATVWENVAARQKGLASMPEQAKAGMKADTCTPAFRARIEHDLAD